MIVLQQISIGLSVILLASIMAESIASALWPSILGMTCQPQALNRAGVSSVNHLLTFPSIEIPLLS